MGRSRPPKPGLGPVERKRARDLLDRPEVTSAEEMDIQIEYAFEVCLRHMDGLREAAQVLRRVREKNRKLKKQQPQRPFRGA